MLHRDHPAAEDRRPARGGNQNGPLLQAFLSFELKDGKAAERAQPLLETKTAPQGHVQKDHDCGRHIGRKVLEDLGKCPMPTRRSADDDQIRDAVRARLPLAPEPFS